MRGFGHGTTFLYHEKDLFGIPGQSAGLVDYWGIYDNGYDNLGIDRSHLQPEVDYRYRFLLQHRQQLPEGFQLTVEGGAISDRNFLQEYFKGEWDTLKDQTTDVELKRTQDNISWNVFASVQTDPFVTQSEWLPRGDHFWLGQPLLGDRLTWFEHSTAGYADYRIATPPTDPADAPFSHMPWEQFNRRGERLISRQELDWPLQAGPVKIVPYALGELGHWGEALDGESLDRAYGQVGVRATLPMWYVDPTVESDLWNVHGLAHKVDFELQVSIAEANRRLTDLPLYDPLNDWSVEAFERRFVTNTYGIGPIAPPGRAPCRCRWTSGSMPFAPAWATGSPRRAWRSPTTWTPSASAFTSDGRPSAVRPTTTTSSIGSNSIRTSRSIPTRAATISATLWGCWTTTSAGTSATG